MMPEVFGWLFDSWEHYHILMSISTVIYMEKILQTFNFAFIFFKNLSGPSEEMLTTAYL